jgi:GT2 family glycosyltransferase
VVALGYHDRMIRCLEHLAALPDSTRYEIVCVVNAVTDTTLRDRVPHGVVVVEFESNLGWVGGLHAARGVARGEFFAWIQDDVFPEPGWLDAMVAAFDADSSIGHAGAVICGEDGAPQGHQAGFTPVAMPIADWPATDHELDNLATEVSYRGWVTSGGSVTRLAIWDEVGGVDVRLWPLNYVDLAYSMHIRAHGYKVALVPQARVRHTRHASSTPYLLDFTNRRNVAHLEPLWRGPADELGEADARPVSHECSPWLGGSTQEIVDRTLSVASTFALAFARATTEEMARRDARAAEDVKEAHALAERAIADIRGTLSWRSTTPLRWVSARLGSARRRR